MRWSCLLVLCIAAPSDAQEKKADEAKRRDELTRMAKSAAKDVAIQAALLRDLRDYLVERSDKLDADDARLTLSVCQLMERVAPKQAADFYDGFAALLSKSPKATAAQVKSMQGAARRLRLVGQDMVVEGIDMAGQAIDWKTYCGKVVLVDFWATWCGPCRAELPNIRKMYDLYHDKGFEVVSISLDAKRDALEKFLDKEKHPWTCLHQNNGKTGHPLASYYGVFAIPRAILVGRDGKVISTMARGQELQRLLKEHIGPAE